MKVLKLIDKIVYYWRMRWRIAKLLYIKGTLMPASYVNYCRMLDLHVSGNYHLIYDSHPNAVFSHMGFTFVNEDDFIVHRITTGKQEESFEFYVVTLEIYVQVISTGSSGG